MQSNLSMSLLEGSTSSDAAQSDCENRTVVWCEKRFEKLFEKRRAGSRLRWMPSVKINEVVKVILQAMSTTSMPRSAGTSG